MAPLVSFEDRLMESKKMCYNRLLQNQKCENKQHSSMLGMISLGALDVFLHDYITIQSEWYPFFRDSRTMSWNLYDPRRGGSQINKTTALQFGEDS